MTCLPMYILVLSEDDKKDKLLQATSSDFLLYLNSIQISANSIIQFDFYVFSSKLPENIDETGGLTSNRNIHNTH